MLNRNRKRVDPAAFREYVCAGHNYKLGRVACHLHFQISRFFLLQRNQTASRAARKSSQTEVRCDDIVQSPYTTQPPGHEKKFLRQKPKKNHHRFS